jgi:hypothetical protein
MASSRSRCSTRSSAICLRMGLKSPSSIRFTREALVPGKFTAERAGWPHFQTDSLSARCSPRRSAREAVLYVQAAGFAGDWRDARKSSRIGRFVAFPGTGPLCRGWTQGARHAGRRPGVGYRPFGLRGK